MIRKLLTAIITLWISVTVIYLLGANYYQKNVVKHPFKLVETKEEIRVNKGDTLYSVIQSLGSEGKLNNSYLVKYYVKKRKITAAIKPGLYNITKDMSLNDFISVLDKGGAEDEDPDILRITIPEGYDIERIAQTFQDKGLISKDEFIKSCKEYILPGYVKSDNKRRYALEGFLFPDTYEFRKGTPADKIIETMIKRFEAVTEDIQKKKNITIDKSELDKIVTMASVVEKEIQKPEERALAASVFYNRLSKGMKLESCATVLYALGVHKDKVLDADLKVESPYNTYIANALPEGPICSPGRASIEAALEPAQTKYLYFVSKNDGTHEFNETFSAHLAAAQKYQGGK